MNNSSEDEDSETTDNVCGTSLRSQVSFQEVFFLEQVNFWPPGNTLASIYDQLSQHKFREIGRKHIEYVFIADIKHLSL